MIATNSIWYLDKHFNPIYNKIWIVLVFYRNRKLNGQSRMDNHEWTITNGQSRMGNHEWTITNGQSRMDNHEWTIQRHRQHWARRQAKHKRPHRRPKREAKRTPPKQNGGEPMGSRMISSSCF